MNDVLLRVENLHVEFKGPRSGLFKPATRVRAVDGVTFDVRRGTAFGIVGESGCGKSTMALAILRLIDSTQGSVLLDGVDLTALDKRALRSARRKFQIIFQDPYSSLNPRSRIEDIVEEPMKLLTSRSPGDRKLRVDELLLRVGLRPDQKPLFPHQFSGGQRQRIGIARALAAEPALIVCDEPVSALDVAIQAQVLNLLADLRRELGLTYVFISHDLGVVQHLCEMVAVMYLGRIVEQGTREQIFARPLHPYTRALLSAEPARDPADRGAKKRVKLKGDPPSPLSPPTGCAFHTRCAHAVLRCAREIPILRDATAGHTVACHLVATDGVVPIAPWQSGEAVVGDEHIVPT